MTGTSLSQLPGNESNVLSGEDRFLLSPEQVLDLWHDFEDIPINDWDEIEAPFLHFPAGTYRFAVWHWFDERWQGGVYELLFL